MIVESNITNNERLYRNFCKIVSTYKPNVEIDKICVEKTPKGNWKVFDKNGNKIGLVSRFMLTDELVDAKNIRKVTN